MVRVGSIYGAPAGCIWGGGRVGEGDQDPGEVLALLEKYGISARSTFSNSLLRGGASCGPEMQRSLRHV